MNIYLITGLFILIGGAQSQDKKCSIQMGMCIQTTLAKHGMSIADATSMMKDGILNLEPDALSKFNPEKICLLLDTVQQCVPTDETGECAKEEMVEKVIVQLPEIINATIMMDCDNCAKKVKKCMDEGITASKVQQNEIDSLLKPDANREELIGNIGKEKGCKFHEVFNGCHDKIKDQCDADDSNFKPVLEITKMAYDQLKCGCATTVASLILIFASILLIFYQKSWEISKL